MQYMYLRLAFCTGERYPPCGEAVCDQHWGKAERFQALTSATLYPQEKNRVAKEQIAADTDEIARLDKELGHVVPKLEALERGLAVKRAEKEALLTDIKKQTEEFNEVRRSSGGCGRDERGYLWVACGLEGRTVERLCFHYELWRRRD
jgi:hypothetical protein